MIFCTTFQSFPPSPRQSFYWPAQSNQNWAVHPLTTLRLEVGLSVGKKNIWQFIFLNLFLFSFCLSSSYKTKLFFYVVLRPIPLTHWCNSMNFYPHWATSMCLWYQVTCWYLNLNICSRLFFCFIAHDLGFPLTNIIFLYIYSLEKKFLIFPVLYTASYISHLNSCLNPCQIRLENSRWSHFLHVAVFQM